MAGVEPDQSMLSDRRARAAELAAERARERADAAQARIAELTGLVDALATELDRAHRETYRLRSLIAARDRPRREALQRAHDERSLRLELQGRLDRAEAQARLALIDAGALAGAEARIRELEQQLEAAAHPDPMLAPAPPDPMLAPAPPDSAPAPVVDPERIDAARMRLRAARPRERELDGGRAWIQSVLARLAPRARKRPATSG
jgi:hypothetical protein